MFFLAEIIFAIDKYLVRSVAFEIILVDTLHRFVRFWMVLCNSVASLKPQNCKIIYLNYNEIRLILLQLLTQFTLPVNILVLLLTTVNFDSKFHHSSTSFIPLPPLWTSRWISRCESFLLLPTKSLLFCTSELARKPF